MVQEAGGTSGPMLGGLDCREGGEGWLYLCPCSPARLPENLFQGEVGTVNLGNKRRWLLTLAATGLPLIAEGVTCVPVYGLGVAGAPLLAFVFFLCLEMSWPGKGAT